MNPQLDVMLRLRDLHAPPDPPWWPPAPGWWVLLVFVLVALWALVRWLPPRWRLFRQRRRLHAQLRHVLATELDGAGAARAAGELSALLRRAVVLTRLDPSAAGAQGADWVACLRAHVPGADVLVDQPELVTDLPYRRSVSSADLAALADLTRRAIDAPLVRPRC